MFWLILLLGVAVILGLRFYFRLPIPDSNLSTELSTKIGKLQEQCSNLEKDKTYWQQLAYVNNKKYEESLIKNKEIISQKASSETKLGQTTEHLLPFLEKFKYDPKEVRFLGSPIDLIAFDFEIPSITFIEVKTNNAKESKRQRIIKNAIKSGHVYYEKMTLNPDGLKIKTEENIT